MKNNLTVAPVLAGLLAGAAALVATTPAAAQDAGVPFCDTFSNTVVISGSSASKPVLQALQTALHNDGIGINIIYASPDSCLGVEDLVGGEISNESSSALLNPAAAGATSFPGTTACGLQSGDAVDIAVSDVFPATCATNVGVDVSGLTEIQGPIQAMTMVTQKTTGTATVINAAAAQVVFGYDAATYTVSPWSVPGEIYIRLSSSGTLNMIGTAIGLKPSLWLGTVPSGGTPGMQGAVAGSNATPAAVIGILSAEAVDQFNTGTLGTGQVPIQILAYQHTGQECGYFPDSSDSAFDKINVRQGRYAIWGPLHFLIKGTAPTGPHAAAMATVLNYLLATGPNPSATPFAGSMDGDAGVTMADAQYLIGVEAKPAYVVPWCAMQAQRSAEIGVESSYTPPEPCSCFYETTVGSVVTGHTCTQCSSTSPCSTGVCRYGYCEAY
jgi:hypothetical protein